jgi:hypothetical protein
MAAPLDVRVLNRQLADPLFQRDELCVLDDVEIRSVLCIDPPTIETPYAVELYPATWAPIAILPRPISAWLFGLMISLYPLSSQPAPCGSLGYRRWHDDVLKCWGLTICCGAPSLRKTEEAAMTYDWNGKRNRLMRAARFTTGAALTLAILSLPILLLV